MDSPGKQDFNTVDDEPLLDWIKNKFSLSEKLVGGDQLFGPFSIARKPTLHVRYEAFSMTWELVTLVDHSVRIYMERRGTIVALADEHRGKLPRGQLVKLLICAAIEVGITNRGGILETVDLALNREAIQQSLDTNVDLSSLPVDFSEDYIKSVLARHQGKRPADHVWWVDDDKRYHLH